MNKMIFANLVHRPVRSIISIVAIAVEVTLILLIVGLSLGMLNDTKSRTVGIGADLMVQPPGSSNLMGISGAPVPLKIADVLRKMNHVAVVSPVIWQLNTSGALEVIYGIDINSFQQLRPFQFLAGGPFEHPDDVIVDDYFATSKNVKVGDRVKILGPSDFRVCGIVLNGHGARKFLPMSTLQDLIGAQGKASIFYVKLDDPKNINLVKQEITSTPGMQQWIVRSMAEYLSMMTAGNLPGLSQFITVVISVSVIIGFIVIFQAMYTAVMERTREIGILKSMGASKLYIVNVILRETVVLAIGGIIAGIVLSLAARRGIHTKLPTLPIQIQPDWILYAIIIAIGGALLGAAYPALKAAQKDPIEALAYE
jgi:putative ABC transport system permease protein